MSGDSSVSHFGVILPTIVKTLSAGMEIVSPIGEILSPIWEILLSSYLGDTVSSILGEILSRIWEILSSYLSLQFWETPRGEFHLMCSVVVLVYY